MNYTQKQWRGLFALMVLLGSLQGMRLMMQRQVPQAFEAIEVEWEDESVALQEHREGFVFDPNTLDQAGWMRWGLSAKQAASIEKYRQSGGVFKTANDLKKLFVIDNEMFERMAPFVMIAESSKHQMGATYQPDLFDVLAKGTGASTADSAMIFSQENLTDKQKAFLWQMRLRGQPEKTPNPIEINSASLEDWTALKGIGTTTANRILAHKNALGGFYAITQLQEVFGLDSLKMKELEPFLLCDQKQLVQIRINLAPQEVLEHHPYIKWKLAKSIVAFREQFKTIDNIKELSKLEGAEPELLIKLAPYLNFSP